MKLLSIIAVLIFSLVGSSAFAVSDICGKIADVRYTRGLQVTLDSGKILVPVDNMSHVTVDHAADNELTICFSYEAPSILWPNGVYEVKVVYPSSQSSNSPVVQETNNVGAGR